MPVAADRRQFTALAVLVFVNAALAFLTLVLGLHTQMMPEGAAEVLPDVAPWLLGLANAALILLVYGGLGVAGIWLARRLELPGVFRPKAGVHRWILVPLVVGLVVGVAVVLIDRLFASLGPWDGFEHPAFPMSLIASATAGIGEEIVFRGFVLGLWAYLLNLILKKWQATQPALWIGNVFAAAAFGAGHIPAAMVLVGASTPAEIPPLVLAEMFVLNGVVGLVAGERYMRDGLVAAIGVHFWADIVWHVVWPMLSAN